MNFKNLIKYCYLAIFLLTPLIFTSVNSELFELPKMYFIYTITILITASHIICWIQGRSPLFKKTPLAIPLLIFLLSQTISTINSIDPHTSFFGYYSRLNGGLLSLICYILLYFILHTHFTIKFRRQIINTSLVAGTLVSVYAIAQHFGIDKHAWIQDVQNRVFSTLGQPNWLGAYLCILLPFSLRQKSKTTSAILISILYLALLFTKSKSAILAATISLVLFFLLSHTRRRLLIPLSIIILLSLTISSPIKDSIFPPPPTPPLQEEVINVTPSQNIRKIVWQGAIDLWRQFPLFGTGVETFAYSYYWTRPIAHNLTSEWEFLYNKAHNEYLNFLATTGALGFATYLLLIFFIIKKTSKKPIILASIASILITNFAGFSVVITSLYFFLLPALAYHNPKHPDPATKPKPKIFYLPPILIAFFLLNQTLRFYLADITYANSQKTDNPKEILSLLKTSLRLRPHEPLYYSKASIAAGQQELADLAISYSNQAISISPANTNFWKERAQMYYSLSAVDKLYFADAIDSLAKVIALAPTDAKTYYLMGRFLQTANLTDKASDFYQQAIELKANYDHSHFALGEIYFQQKNFPQAQSHFESALQINPKNTAAQNYLNQINPQ